MIAVRRCGPVSTALAAAAVVLPGPQPVATGAPPGSDLVRVHTVRYIANDGRSHRAFVAVPAGYDQGLGLPIPLVIALHGRGATAESMLARFGDLPAVGSFALVSPEGQGRRLRRFSWGYAGQIDDLAKMPGVVERALPWLALDRDRVYAFGTSMGGQEALLLAARHPGLLTGVAAFDATTDFALQYWNFGKLPCRGTCRHEWGGGLGAILRRLARTEVGANPAAMPRAYGLRSPLKYARRLAVTGIPIQLWWSADDEVVREPGRQSGALFDRLIGFNPAMPVEAIVGHWTHSTMMYSTAGLPHALARFGLLPSAFGRAPANVDVYAPGSDGGDGAIGASAAAG